MNRRPPGQLRIIAGHLRGSRLPVPDRPGLRPTSDRVRETLFNWLQPGLAGARVLDAFAGSGALGFEAASRGAAAVLMLERDPALAASLQASAARLGAASVRVEAVDALAWLARPASQAFDLVFVDPPFQAGLWPGVLARLGPWLAPGARVYLESPRDAPPPVPPGWRLHREGETREVRYALFHAGAGGAADAAATLAPESPTPGIPEA